MGVDQVVTITGAAGCLGLSTLKLLVSRDDSVREIRCIDLIAPSHLQLQQVEQEQKNLQARTGSRKRLNWFKGDIRDINLVEQVVEGSDCIIHCAAAVDIWTETSQQDADRLRSINVDGTETLIKASIRLGVPRFIHVSSFEVYSNYGTLYFATEATLPELNSFLFGPSGSTKKEAEDVARRYANNKLQKTAKDGKDSLNLIIVRCPEIYGEYDKHFVSKILEATKFFGGRLQKLDNVWIRQQPIYVGNIAWCLVRANQIMQDDMSISGEEFHITDDTPIGDPFEFMEPFLDCKGFQLTKSSYSFFPVLLIIIILGWLRSCLATIDIFHLFTERKGRLHEAMKQDKDESVQLPKAIKWHHYAMPQTLAMICVSRFLNRTKASLRLKYEPIYKPDEARERSLDWYKNHLSIR